MDVNIQFSTNEEGKVTAQELYNLRAVTGFCSGMELHELFKKLVGEPSPSGRKTFRTYRLATTNSTGQKALDLLNDGAEICRLADYCLD